MWRALQELHGAGGQGGPSGSWGGLGMHGTGVGCVEAVQGQPVQGEGGHSKHESLWGDVGDTQWVARVCRGVHILLHIEGCFGGRREQPWAESHHGGPSVQRLSQAAVWLGQGRPEVTKGCTHPWDKRVTRTNSGKYKETMGRGVCQNPLSLLAPYAGTGWVSV